MSIRFSTNIKKAIFALCLSSILLAHGANQTPEIRLVLGNNKFALKMYKQLQNTRGNLFFSPYSISSALAMTAAGASGETLQQMHNVLCLPTKINHNSAFSILTDNLNKIQESGQIQLSVANSLWPQSFC